MYVIRKIDAFLLIIHPYLLKVDGNNAVHLIWCGQQAIPLLGEMSVRTKGLRHANGRTVGERTVVLFIKIDQQ